MAFEKNAIVNPEFMIQLEKRAFALDSGAASPKSNSPLRA
jgi:hypothetical protein